MPPKKKSQGLVAWQTAYDESVEAYESEDFKAAAKLANEAISIAEGMGASGEESLGQSLNVLAGALRASEKYTEAADVSRRAVGLLEKHLPETDTDLTGTMHNTAWLFAAAGKIEEAAKFYDKALALAASSWGPRHPQRGSICLSFLGLIASNSQLESRLEECLEGLRAAMVEDDDGEFVERAVGNCIDYFLEHNEPLAFDLINHGVRCLHASYKKEFKSLMESPTWVMNFSLARVVLDRKGYQEDGIWPVPLVNISYTLATLFCKRGKYQEAVEVFKGMDASIKKTPLTAKERKTPWGGTNKYFIDRAEYNFNYGTALHFIAEASEDVAFLKLAMEKYALAEKFLPEVDEEERAEMKEKIGANNAQAKVQLIAWS